MQLMKNRYLKIGLLNRVFEKQSYNSLTNSLTGIKNLDIIEVIFNLEHPGGFEPSHK